MYAPPHVRCGGAFPFYPSMPYLLFGDSWGTRFPIQGYPSV